MKETVLNQVAVQEYFRRHFRMLMVDTEGDTLITDFSGTEIAEKDFALKHNRVRATPVFAFFDLQGKLLTKYTGATRDPQEFLWLGEFVVDGHYRNTRFTKYKRKKRAAARNNS
jgi:thioredoxin-related protein